LSTHNASPSSWVDKSPFGGLCAQVAAPSLGSHPRCGEGTATGHNTERLPSGGDRVTRTLLAAAGFAALALLALTLPPVASAYQPQLKRYPYLTDVVGSNATVNWATDQSRTSGTIKYGKVGSEPCTAHSKTASRSTITVNAVPQYQWLANLTGLTQGARYCYRIQLGTTSPVIDLLGTDASPEFYAQLPAGSSEPFSFAVLGDWGAVGDTQAGPDNKQADVMSQIAASGVRFALGTGDTAYPSGSQTNYGDLIQTGANISTVFAPEFWKKVGASTPMFNATGNHGFNSTFLSIWPQSTAVVGSGGRYVMDTYCCLNDTTSASYPSAWYAFDAGNARFYVLEAAWSTSNVGTADRYKNDYDTHWTPTSAEYQWLENDLRTHPSRLKFAFFHFPLYSSDPGEPSDTYLQGTNSLEGLLARHGVDIAFSGHGHNYTRTVKPSGDSLVTYMTGGGGARLRPATTCAFPVAYALGWSYSSGGSACVDGAPAGTGLPTSIDQVFHFLKVSVDGNRVTVTPTDSQGRTFDVKTYDFSGTDVSLSPTADAPVKEASPTTNFGGENLRVDAGSDPDVESYLNFSVSGVSGPIQSAKLRLYAYTGTANGPAVYSTSTAWSEGGITWSNRPAPTSAATDDKGTIAGNSWVEYDVTPFVTGNGSYGFRLAGTSSDGVDFYSREAPAGSPRPQLVLTVAGSGQPPSDTTPPTPPTELTANAPSPNSVELSWTAATDAVGVTGYEIYRDDKLLATTSGGGTSYGDTTASPNTTYTYKVRAFDAASNLSGFSNTATVTTPAGAPAGIGFVKQATGATPASTSSFTVPITSTSGNTLVAPIAVQAGTTTSVSSVTDSAGNIWTRGPVGFLSGSNTRIEIWYRTGAAPVTSVTVNLSAPDLASANVSEWRGVATAAALDTSGGQGNVSSTTAATPSITTTNANDLVVGAINFPLAVTSTLATAGFTSLADFTVSTVKGRAAYRIVPATGSSSAAWALSGSSTSGSAILALKAAP
jgi:hypothetical protein